MRSGTTVSREHVFDRCGNCEIHGFALLVTQTGNARATIEVMATPQVLILQHVPWERPGRILSNLEDIGLETVTMNIVDKKKPDLPDFGELAGVVIMGGPMGALDYDKYPGLKAEAKLARAAVAVGISGLFMETHPRPEQAFSDGPNSWPLDRMASLLRVLMALDRSLKAGGLEDTQ